MATHVGHYPWSPMRVAGHPIYPVLLPIPILCFVGALITDIVYAGAPDMMWLDFSSWLLLAGLIAGGVAGVVLIVEMVRARRVAIGALRLHFVLLLSAWIVEVFNSFIHARDGFTAVVPTGLALSILAVVLCLAGGWAWRSATPMTGAVR